VLVADEPDPDRPDDWLIHAYFDHQPSAEEIASIAALGDGNARTDSLGEEDWVTMSQSGLEPIHFANIADIGTGTGLLAFAALALWPDAKCIATDIDQIAVDVARENAVINRVPIGHGAGELLIATADGMESPLLAARAPFDLLIANILAGPLIELAPDFTKALAQGGTIVLAGLLDTQAATVAAAYEALGCTLQDRGSGEWPVLVLQAD